MNLKEMGYGSVKWNEMLQHKRDGEHFAIGLVLARFRITNKRLSRDVK
jgi:hypothetical protein